MPEPTRLPKSLRRRWFDDRGRPLCNCGGAYRQHAILWAKCFCNPDCTCTQYATQAVGA